MNTINVDLSTGEALNLPIGRQGENNVTQVIFDFSALKTEFGSGTLSLSVKRPKEYVPYAQPMTISGTNATWLVNETDTGNFGCGEIQLTYTVSGKVAKTVIYKYTVLRSIGADGEYPIPGQTWQEEMEDEIAEIKEDLSDLQEEIEGGGGGGGMSADFKQALHNILEKVAYIDDDGQTYLNALDSAMYPPVTAIRLNTNSLSFASLNSTQQLTATTTPSGGAVTWASSNTSVATVSSTGLVTSVGYGNAIITATSGSVSATCSVVVAQATLVSISAVYTQSGTVYDTDSLDSLKSDLVVTAHWSNSTTSTVASNDYTLSGTLTTGTSTITVSYGGKTTTFTVDVSSTPLEPVEGAYAIWDARDYTVGQAWSDRIGNIALTPTGSPAKSENAVLFDGTDDYFTFGTLSVPRTLEMVTIQASVKLADLTKTSFIVVDNITSSSRIVIGLRPQDGAIRIQSGTKTMNYTYAFDTNWHLFTFVLGGDSQYIYVDTTLIEHSTNAFVIVADKLNQSTALLMGAYPLYNGYASMYFRSLYIYANVLGAEDVANNYSLESDLWE